MFNILQLDIQFTTKRKNIRLEWYLSTIIAVVVVMLSHKLINVAVEEISNIQSKPEPIESKSDVKPKTKMPNKAQ
jgi:hypothetical protein